MSEKQSNLPQKVGETFRLKAKESHTPAKMRRRGAAIIAATALLTSGATAKLLSGGEDQSKGYDASISKFSSSEQEKSFLQEAIYKDEKVSLKRSTYILKPGLNVRHTPQMVQSSDGDTGNVAQKLETPVVVSNPIFRVDPSDTTNPDSYIGFRFGNETEASNVTEHAKEIFWVNLTQAEQQDLVSEFDRGEGQDDTFDATFEEKYGNMLLPESTENAGVPIARALEAKDMNQAMAIAGMDIVAQN